MKLRSLALALD